MKIIEKIKKGNLQGWSIRKSKYGWCDLYSSSGISQTQGKLTFDQIKELINKTNE